MHLNIGDMAPDVSLQNAAGKTVQLKDFRGQTVIVYFYPKDNTPGCTIQAQAFRDAKTQLEAKNVVVLGISKDSVKSHVKFSERFDLNFDLLADVDVEACQAYGVYKEKSMFGKKYMGVERSTFLVDPKGQITAIWRKVKIKGHLEEVLAAFSV